MLKSEGHLFDEAERKVIWTRVRFSPPPPKAHRKYDAV